MTLQIIRRAVTANNNAEQNLRDLIGYIMYFCEKTITVDALKGCVTNG